MLIQPMRFLTKECETANSIIYDLAIVDPTEGFTLEKYYIENKADVIQGFLAEVEDYLGGKGNYQYFEFENPPHQTFKSTFGYIENLELKEFSRQLFDILSLPPMVLEDYSNDNIITMLYPQYLLFSSESFAIKLPIQKRDKLTGLPTWYYVYLIEPELGVNQETLKLLERAYGRKYDLNPEEVTRHVNFSVTLYEVFRMKMFDAAVKAKSVVNAMQSLRYMEDPTAVTEFTSIFQNTQMIKQDKMVTPKWEYMGRWSIPTMPQAFRLLGYEPEDVFTINAHANEREAFIIEHGEDPRYNPITYYMRCTDLSSSECMQLYEEVERDRQFYKILIYLMNMSFGRSILNNVKYMRQLHFTFMEPNPVNCGLELEWQIGEHITNLKRKTYKPRAKKGASWK